MKTFLLLFLSFPLLFIKVYGQIEDTVTREVIILHTNDMHSKIDNLARLAYLKDSLKKTHPYVFLVSAGDLFTGNPVVDMASDKGFPMIDLMNQVGFDLSCMGNHEFDPGQDFLSKRIRQAAFPLVCSNLDVLQLPLFQPPPYAILSVDTLVRLACLGVIQTGENGLPDSHPLKLKGLRFFPALIQAGRYTDLKEKYGNLIVLSHLGVDQDLLFAEKFPETDLVIGGHSHTLIDTPLFHKGVLIAQAGSHMRQVGKITLKVKGGHILSKTSEVILFDRLKKENEQIRKSIDAYNKNPEFLVPVAKAEYALVGYEALGGLMTDALTAMLKVDVAFQNTGGIRIDSIPAGDITLRDVYRLDPFGNQVVVMKMTIDEIKSLIRYGYEIKKTPDLYVSGMKYTLVTDKQRKLLDIEINVDGRKKLNDPNLRLNIAMNSYVASRYVFDHSDEGYLAGPTTSDLLIDFLKEKKSVNYLNTKRVFMRIK